MFLPRASGIFVGRAGKRESRPPCSFCWPAPLCLCFLLYFLPCPALPRLLNTAPPLHIPVASAPAATSQKVIGSPLSRTCAPQRAVHDPMWLSESGVRPATSRHVRNRVRTRLTLVVFWHTSNKNEAAATMPEGDWLRVGIRWRQEQQQQLPRQTFVMQAAPELPTVRRASLLMTMVPRQEAR